MLRNQRIILFLQITVMLFCLLGLAGSALAQKKPVRKSAPKAAPKPVVNTMAVKDEAEKVSIQIKDLTRFLYLLGGTTQTIANIDGDPKPELRPYISFIQGVSEMAGIAEDQAVGGQLGNAGKTLLEVVNKLTDTLQNLR